MKSTKELQIGDWVYDDNGFPMFVQALFDDDTVYLDFDGNEADTWETDIKDIEPIPITGKILENNGFILDDEYKFIFRNISLSDDIRYGWYIEIKIENSLLTLIKLNIQYVHELQQALRLCKIDKEIVL